MINVETYFAYLKCISILPVCTIANRKDRIHYLLKSYLFIINVIPLTYTKCISHYTIYIHKTYLIKSVCQMYLHLAIFRHRGQFLSSDSREAETAKIRKLDRTLNIIDLIYKPEHFLSLSLSLSMPWHISPLLRPDFSRIHYFLSEIIRRRLPPPRLLRRIPTRREA